MTESDFRNDLDVINFFRPKKRTIVIVVVVVVVVVVVSVGVVVARLYFILVTDSGVHCASLVSRNEV